MSLSRALLVGLGVLVALAAWSRSLHELAWPDEYIYLTGARNIVERGSLDTQYYLTRSLLVRGYPHRDVHMPGYILALAPLVKGFGTTLRAAATLNVALFLVSILLVQALARRLLESEEGAILSAALFALAPPTAGYLFIVYPELLTTFALLIAVFLSARASGAAGALLAGAVFGLGALARETLLVALPIHFALLPRRLFVRGFLPGALGALLLVVAPLARGRAVHPNAIYPSVLEDARRSASPLATLAGALAKNARQNLDDIANANPLGDTEDRVLFVLLLLAVLGVGSLVRLPPRARRMAWAVLVSLLALSIAVILLYVVRVRGGVWGGVRAYMSFEPLLAILVAGGLWSLRFAARAPLAASLLYLFWISTTDQLYLFWRFKGQNLEDDARCSRYVAEVVGRSAPHRIAGRLFQYGLSNYPTETIWSLPRDYPELVALERAVSYDYMVLAPQSPLRLFLIRNPRYLRVNKDDRGAELLIFRRLD